MLKPESNENACHNKPPRLNPNIIQVPKDRDINAPHKPWDHRPTDVVLLTAKPWEFLNCYPYLENVYKSYNEDLGHVYFGEIVNDSREKVKVSLVRCDEGSTTAQGSMVVGMNAIATLEPKAIICVGFCGMLNSEKTKLGDVVISGKLATYIRGRGSIIYASRNMGKLVSSAAHGWNAPLENPECLEVKVHCQDKVMLSGPVLFDNDEVRRQLLQEYPNAIAIEMEGEGVYVAAYDRQIEWVIIKGISDFADGSKTETAEWRSFSSAMAASVVHHILKQADVLKDWPHYKKPTDK